jgi:hypothetical protein
MVKKSKKPKYCENSNMFPEFWNNTNVSLIFFLPIKNHKIFQKFIIEIYPFPLFWTQIWNGI